MGSPGDIVKGKTGRPRRAMPRESVPEENEPALDGQWRGEALPCAAYAAARSDFPQAS
jgi:hypothetical protein